MKILIIYHSEHHQNTEKIAKVMAIKVGADIIKAEDLNLCHPSPALNHSVSTIEPVNRNYN